MYGGTIIRGRKMKGTIRLTSKVIHLPRSDPSDKKKSLREQLMANIADQEKQARLLKEEQKVVKDSASAAASQLKMWEDLIK